MLRSMVVAISPIGRRSRITVCHALVVIAAIPATPCSQAAPERRSESKHDFFLVDVSGSMGKGRLDIRKKLLKHWIGAHPSAGITLMSFGKTITSKKTLDLARNKDRDGALYWVDHLVPQIGNYSFVSACCGEALRDASNYVKEHPEEAALLHVLTDGEDNEDGHDLDNVLRRFPNATREPEPEELAQSGDFAIRIAAVIPPPLPPTATPRTSPSSTPTAAPTPSPTASATPAVGATASPAPLPSPTPCLSGSTEEVRPAFEMKEPRAVFCNQVVHFINMTTPDDCCTSWTLERIEIDSAGKENKTREATSANKHFNYRFKPLSNPQSYLVSLTVTCGEHSFSAIPTLLTVRPEPTGGSKIWSDIKTNAAGWVGIITSLITAAGTVISALWIREQWRRKNRTDWKTLGIAAFGMVCFIVLIATLILGSGSGAGERTISQSVSVVTGPASAPSSDAHEPILIQTNNSLLPVVLASLLLGLSIVAAALIRSSHQKQELEAVREATARFPSKSALVRWEEAKRLYESGLLSKPFLGRLKAKFVEEVQEEFYAERVRSDLANLEKFIDALTSATRKNILEWRAFTELEAPAVSSPSEVTNESPFGVRRNIVGFTTLLNFDAGGDASVSIAQVELYGTDSFARMDILTSERVVLESIGLETHDLWRERLKLDDLHELAKRSALPLGEQIDILITKLTELGKPPDLYS